MNSMTPLVALPRPGALDAFLRRRLLAQLAPMRDGRLCVRDALGEVWLGDARGELHVTVTIDDPGFYRKVAAQGSVGAGESYIQGEWHCDDLVALIRLLVRNRDLLDGMERGPARVGGWLLRGWNRLRRNSREGSRRNIAAHYDLGNDFFALFLSPDLMYSSALFASESEPLESASRRKLDRICQQLQLKPGDHVVEIGTGWGGFRGPCRPALWLPCHDHHHLCRTACAGRPARTGGGPSGPGHAADAGLPRPAGPVRQAGVDRDDRSDRRRIPGHLHGHAAAPAQA